jgi:class 3 adenylate cyclase
MAEIGVMQGNEELGRERHLVVVFDICSSTTILEDLKRTDNLAAWRDLLLDMKANLQEEGIRAGMCLYKFIGDGWVLLFPDAVPKKDLCGFLCRISEWYHGQFERSIRPLLLQEPSPIGLMFGIDLGELIRLDLDDQVEYLGRAINVASRLQTQTKELRGGPSYKAIFSRNSFNSPGPPPRDIAVESTKVSLRNISPSTIECFIFQTLQPPAEKQGTSRQPRLETAIKSPKPTQSQTKPPTTPPVPPFVQASVAPADPKVPSAHIRVADLRPTRISPISELGKWTWHDEGQLSAVIQFKNEAQKDPAVNKNAVAKALLIYRAGEKELLRINGSWVDGHDQAKFNANDTRGLIIGVTGDEGFRVLEAVRAKVNGTERVEIRPSRFDPPGTKLTVLVQLTDAKGRDLLYEGEFAIGTDPLTIAPTQ